MDDMNMMNNLVNGANIKFDTSDLLNRLQAASFNAGRNKGYMEGWNACSNDWFDTLLQTNVKQLPPTKPKKSHRVRNIIIGGLVIAGGYYILDKYVIKPKKAAAYNFTVKRKEDLDTDFDFEVDEDELH